MEIKPSNLGTQEQCKQVPITYPAQHQDTQPGLETLMNPRPIFDDPAYKGTGKLEGKTALITGGDSGIGRAAAVAFAKEGANISVIYYNEHEDAEETKAYIEGLGGRCLLVSGDIRDICFCKKSVQETADAFGCLDILVNNAGVQYPQNGLENITAAQLETTFQVNVFGMFYMTQAALPFLGQGSAIINTTSVTAYEGNPQLIDYSSTKGAIVSFTRAMANSLAGKSIRVNGVAPGPVWTPLQPASWDAQHIATFGASTPMKRAGEPAELAATYVYLASGDSSFVTGQILHVNGGENMSS